jgi:pilus assembly protein CpaF
LAFCERVFFAHANSTRHLQWRLETMAMMSDVGLPAAHMRAQVAAAIDVIVQLARLRDGRRVLWEIAVVEGTRRGEPGVEPVFRFKLRDGIDGGSVSVGTFPDLVTTLVDRGESLDPAMFEAGEDA